MTVRFFYVDESYDNSRYCLSALSIRHVDWKMCFDIVKEHRANLKADFGIPLRKEIHARDLVAGRGSLGNSTLGKWQRSRVFLGLLRLVSSLPNIRVFNVCLNKSDHRDPQMVAWNRLINRIERTMYEYEQNEIPLRQKLSESASQYLSSEDALKLTIRLNGYAARAVIIADEGREYQITSALRRMHVYNHVPSRYGQWGPGRPTRNIPTERLIEDPIFKRSERSYFIQLADCVAFALLKREVDPTPNVERYGIHEMFDQTLTGVCFKKASPKDPLGIVRR